MGQQQSKSELLYQQVSCGNIEGIKALHREGANLEWIDREGKTPLIVACMNSELRHVAKTLIELGANVNAYRPGRHAGTPLHHAAKRGLESTVKLLLSHGANALVMNDDCQTPLDVARAKGHTSVVRTIESHVCLFSGWLREFYGPGFLEVLAPQLVSRKVWVVVLPGGSRNLSRPFKLELAIYSSLQDAQPRIVIALWKANLEAPKLYHSDPSVIIIENSTKTRVKLAPATENDNQQLKWFCDACKGIPQAQPAFLHTNQTPVLPTAPLDAEDLQIAVAINASIQSAMQDVPALVDAHPNSGASSSNSVVNTTKHGGLGVPSAHAQPNTESMHEPGPGINSTQHMQIESNTAVAQTGSDSIPVGSTYCT
ncbi:putative Ankyrin repeat domain protein [Quillaja saponaria]|uniref:Ankyrin repeat domain protein n=1 Tax=Quillaja saponaria TaxID=32244 RepID=A0AAD7PH56_QUISA|nr:putative Ankyrin repeat domain protein [Quillaja saponaria]